MVQYKYVLEEKDTPSHWYNIIADMENPPPPYRHPATLGIM
jgi:tryptophan synthase beta chain